MVTFGMAEMEISNLSKRKMEKEKKNLFCNKVFALLNAESNEQNPGSWTSLCLFVTVRALWLGLNVKDGRMECLISIITPISSSVTLVTVFFKVNFCFRLSSTCIYQENCILILSCPKLMHWYCWNNFSIYHLV